ncbi:hypothetical protein [Hoeflea poritis]|uniref:Uncharacterized protein n=1 Tax=Hoeflea poritis TaxID=2993659 RepID=A0ABT4VH02_9HYPH|nr:hypothetical protein [Hoeflea poritis]MDA4843980.1 hypothetical protein [Hoeflea poritis]
MKKYLTIEKEREDAILDNTDQKFQFQHQEIDEIPEFKYGISENEVDINPFGLPVKLSLQANKGAGKFVREHAGVIEKAAKEFAVGTDLVKAVIYTEMARGWYDKLNPLGSPTVLPGNVDKTWEALIPGSDRHNRNDNIRITAKLLSEIEKRLDVPFPEDVYSLYNSMAHDRTYRNKELKSTPYFLKKVLEARAWEQENWSLDKERRQPHRRSTKRLLSGDLTRLGSDRRPYLPNHLRLLPPSLVPQVKGSTRLEDIARPPANRFGR